MINRDLPEDLIELVDGAGGHVGTIGRLEAHRPPGKRHRAFSAFLFDQYGRLLLQRRAAGAQLCPGMWSNSCSGHPRPREAPGRAVRRQIATELGVMPQDLAQAGTIIYQLTDPMSGLVEHEYSHVFVGRVLDLPLPDPSWVADAAMVTATELRQMLDREPFSVWFETVAYVAMTAAPALLPAVVDAGPRAVLRVVRDRGPRGDAGGPRPVARDYLRSVDAQPFTARRLNVDQA
jgi:isopentenyl-diphosphate delta-isomerase